MYDRQVRFTRKGGNYESKYTPDKIYEFLLRRHIDENDPEDSRKWRMQKMNEIASTKVGHAYINKLISNIKERMPKLREKLAHIQAFPGIPQVQYEALTDKEKKRFKENIVIGDGKDALVYFKDMKAIRKAEHELMMAPMLKKELKEISEYWDIKHSTGNTSVDDYEPCATQTIKNK